MYILHQLETQNDKENRREKKNVVWRLWNFISTNSTSVTSKSQSHEHSHDKIRFSSENKNKMHSIEDLKNAHFVYDHLYASCPSIQYEMEWHELNCHWCWDDETTVQRERERDSMKSWNWFFLIANIFKGSGEKENKSAVLNKNPTASSTKVNSAKTGKPNAPTQNGQQTNRNLTERPPREG